MRVMLATDGSAPADVAVNLVASCRWPADTSIDVVGVLDAVALLPAPFAPSPVNVQPLEDALNDQLTEAIDQTAGQLRAGNVSVTTTLRVGRPIECLLERAMEIRADLIVCGSRGQGELRSLVLGSVSAGLADRAPCPVLVARHPKLERVLLADDGTDPALVAEDVVASWPMFERVPVDVVSINYVHPAWRSGFSMLTVGPGLETYEVEVREARERVKQVCDDAVARLDAAGRRATGTVREGDPAGVILATAESEAADMIVVGTHGRTGLDRLMLGSVARAVLMHAHTSVLIARPSRFGHGREHAADERAQLAGVGDTR